MSKLEGGQPPSYVRNCLTMGRGERLFLYYGDVVLPTLDGYAIIPLGHYYDLLGLSPLPESLSRYQEDVLAYSASRIRTALRGSSGPSVALGSRRGRLSLA
jgi:hypothetical protein